MLRRKASSTFSKRFAWREANEEQIHFLCVTCGSVCQPCSTIHGWLCVNHSPISALADWFSCQWFTSPLEARKSSQWSKGTPKVCSKGFYVEVLEQFWPILETSCDDSPITKTHFHEFTAMHVICSYMELCRLLTILVIDLLSVKVFTAKSYTVDSRSSAFSFPILIQLLIAWI